MPLYQLFEINRRMHPTSDSVTTSDTSITSDAVSPIVSTILFNRNNLFNQNVNLSVALTTLTVDN